MGNFSSQARASSLCNAPAARSVHAVQFGPVDGGTGCLAYGVELGVGDLAQLLSTLGAGALAPVVPGEVQLRPEVCRDPGLLARRGYQGVGFGHGLGSGRGHVLPAGVVEPVLGRDLALELGEQLGRAGLDPVACHLAPQLDDALLSRPGRLRSCRSLAFLLEGLGRCIDGSKAHSIMALELRRLAAIAFLEPLEVAGLHPSPEAVRPEQVLMADVVMGHALTIGDGLAGDAG